MSEIRISCASLASIVIDGKYLLCMNKSSFKKGNYIYTPFGGAIEFLPKALDFLTNIDAEFERETPDLRFKMDDEYLRLYKTWFDKQIDREVGINRELIEELVEEENIFDSLSPNDFKSTYLKLVEDKSFYSPNGENKGIMNYRYFEIYSVEFNHNKEEEIKSILNSYAEESIQKLKLVSKEEIMKGITDTGIKIGDNSKAIIQ